MEELANHPVIRSKLVNLDRYSKDISYSLKAKKDSLDKAAKAEAVLFRQLLAARKIHSNNIDTSYEQNVKTVSANHERAKKIKEERVKEFNDLCHTISLNLPAELEPLLPLLLSTVTRPRETQLPVHRVDPDKEAFLTDTLNDASVSGSQSESRTTIDLTSASNDGEDEKPGTPKRVKLEKPDAVGPPTPA
eukprot:jgi/Mesvir1/21399/Mv20878-RA.1